MELNNCPFCGGNDFSIKRNFSLDGITFVCCEPCGAVVSFQGNELLDDTIRMYNNREHDSSRHILES